MSNLESYRSSTDYREILRILQRASSLQENIVWQTTSSGRSVIPVHHFEIDFVTREVVVFFDSVKYEINTDLPLYVKLDYRTSVFKVANFRQGQFSLHFSFPAEVKTQELRMNPRHQILPNVEKTITVRPSLTGHGRETGQELTLRTLDVSEMGAGLMVSEQNRTYLKNNRILWVIKVQDVTLDVPVLSEVVYINNEIDPKYQARKQKELKVGLKLSDSLPPEIYQKFFN